MWVRQLRKLSIVFLEFPVMILPAKTADGLSMPDTERAFWPFFFFFLKS